MLYKILSYADEENVPIGKIDVQVVYRMNS